MKKKHFKQGKFNLAHPERYVGDPNKIRYLSGWELKMMLELDSPNSLFSGKWGSEIIPINYFCSTRKTWHRYFPDIFLFPFDKSKKNVVIEIKPKKQINLPINQCKFAYAKQWCYNNNSDFLILSEEYFISN